MPAPSYRERLTLEGAVLATSGAIGSAAPLMARGERRSGRRFVRLPGSRLGFRQA